MVNTLLTKIEYLFYHFIVFYSVLTLSLLPTLMDPIVFFEKKEFFFLDICYLYTNLFVKN